VDLRGLLQGEPTLSSLVLGVTMDDSGNRETVTGDLAQLVHIAVGGSSGFGKSVFLQALAWQLANARERTDLVAVDLEGVTLNVLAQSERLLYPLADNEEDAVAVLGAVTEELERRKALYGEAGAGIASLGAYNARVDDDQRLKPIVLLVDEATALLDDKSVESALRTVTLRARKYGVWAVLAGQDWKASSLDTAIRNQLATRVQFRAMSASQSRVLLGTGDAADIQAKGRAIAEIPGRGRLMIQAPMVTAAMFAAAIRANGPQRGMPDPAPVGVIEDDVTLPDEVRIRRLAAQGMSLNEIQRRVLGGVGGNYYYRVRDVLGDNRVSEQ
jgi:S-DNA-T family DNA segregation ATPase FtsK/SpoIIIE